MANEKETQEQVTVRNCISRLMEHFDTVQIFLTRHNEKDNSTETTTAGGGNFFARYGQVRAWAEQQAVDVFSPNGGSGFNAAGTVASESDEGEEEEEEPAGG